MGQQSPNILIVKLSAIGDVVHTLPALNALRNHYPDAHITWVVEEAAANLVIGHQALDRVLISRRKQWSKQISKGRLLDSGRQALAFIRALRETRFDIILDFQAALKGAAIIALANGDRKIGFGPGMEHQEHSYLFLNEKIPMVDMEVHALKRGLMLLEAIGVPCPEVAYHLPIDTESKRKAGRLVPASSSGVSRLPVAINPVAQWETKLWLPDRFAALADRLIDDHGADIYFTGGGDDRPVIDRIINTMRHGASNLAGKTSLIELAALYRRMALVISTDTGPMHIAAAVDAPVIALFGPTAEWRTGPYGDKHQVVAPDLDCRPCYKRTCDHCDCMRSIGVDDVMQKIDVLL